MAKGAHISALRAEDPQGKIREGELLRHFQLVNGHRTRLTLHRFALPRQVIELLPADLNGGKHGRNLHNIADEPAQHGTQIVHAHLHRMLLQRFAGGVLRVGDLP